MSVRAFQKSHAMRWTAGLLGVLGLAGFIGWLVQRGTGPSPVRVGA